MTCLDEDLRSPSASRFIAGMMATESYRSTVNTTRNKLRVISNCACQSTAYESRNSAHNSKYIHLSFASWCCHPNVYLRCLSSRWSTGTVRYLPLRKAAVTHCILHKPYSLTPTPSNDALYWRTTIMRASCNATVREFPACKPDAQCCFSLTSNAKYSVQCCCADRIQLLRFLFGG